MQGSLSDVSKEDGSGLILFRTIGIIAVAYFFYKLGKRSKKV